MSIWNLIERILLNEARFPDEKFFGRDGSPIQMRSGGPPKGTVGRTSRDLGVKRTAYLDMLDPGGVDWKAFEREAKALGIDVSGAGNGSYALHGNEDDIKQLIAKFGLNPTPRDELEWIDV